MLVHSHKIYLLSQKLFLVYVNFLIPSALDQCALFLEENRDYIATVSIAGKNKDDYKKDFIERIFKKGKIRLISGRESARLQGFSDKFKIHPNDKIAKKQFGNAVPTNVVYYLTKIIAKKLK